MAQKAQPKRKPRPATEVKKKNFLEKLHEAGGIVFNACHAAGVNRRSVYRWREEDLEFADTWDETVKRCLMERLIEASHEPKNPAVLIFMGKAVLGLSDGAGDLEEAKRTIRELQLERERMRLVVYRACKGNPKLRQRITAEIAAFNELGENGVN